MFVVNCNPTTGSVLDMSHRLADVTRQHLSPRLTVAHAAAVMLLVPAAACNMLFGYSLGSATPFSGTIGAVASLGVDLFNAIGLILIAAAWKSRHWLKAAACSAVLAGTILFSIQAGLGYVTSGREGAIGKAQATADVGARAEASRKAVEAEIAALGYTRPLTELLALEAAVMADPRAGGCSTINTDYKRRVCKDYFDIQAERGRAERLSSLKAELADLNTKLDQRTTLAEADPLGSTIAAYLRLLDVSVTNDDIRPWQSLLFTLILVLGGPIALWAAEGSISRQPDRPKTPEPDTGEKLPHTEPAKEPVKPKLEIVAKADKPEPVKPKKAAKEPAKKSAKRVDELSDHDRLASVLIALKRDGGTIQRESQRELADALGIPRTSLRRALGTLEREKLVTVDKSGAWRVAFVQ